MARNEPAFPSEWYPEGGSSSQGMSTRAYIATQAMKGLLTRSSSVFDTDMGPMPCPTLFKLAVKCADSLLAELDNK